MIRKNAVAGQFYPHNPNKLKIMIESFIEKETSKIDAKGIIMPHAGYIYSGKVATVTVEKIRPKKRVIILGPNHMGTGETFSMFSRGEWEIPSGRIKIDEELAQAILNHSDLIKEDVSAHIYEHSIEVELPILHYFFKDFKFLPIVCSLSSLETYRKVAHHIFKTIKNIKDDILIIASSDMTHYEEDYRARKKDSYAIESIVKLNEEELLKRIKEKDISMCGVAPVSILIACCKLLKAKKATVTLYRTSGDITKDTSSVVGYLGAVIY